MGQYEISVIIPIYNAAEKLPRCVSSIVRQSFTDFELLLVDDGSTDGSTHLCDQYAARYDFVRTLHKENGGVSSARNCGLQAATGRFIVFVDADDCVGEHYLDTLTAHAGQDDICIGGMTLNYADGQSVTPAIADEYCREHDEMGRILLRLDRQDIPISACNCLLRKAVIDAHKLRFDEDIRVCEDADFILRYLAQAESLRLVSQSNYFYDVPPDTKTYGGTGGLYTSLKLIADVYALTTDEGVRRDYRRKYLDWATEELFYYKDTKPLKPLAHQYARLCQPYLDECRRPSFRHRLFKRLCFSSNAGYIIFLSRAVILLYNTLRKCRIQR